MTKYVPIETIKYELSKIRKSSNFQYKQAIDRNRKNQVKHPPLIDLLNFLKHSNTPETEIDKIVGEYWSEVEKNKNFEKEIANKLKIKYSKYR
jgi:hypothetical protein